MAPASSSGAPLDPDGDSVAGPLDLCPEEAGLPPDGCPLRDGDGDGILDPDDACPAEPECRNGFEDEDGCPDLQPEDLAAVLGVIEDLRFPPDDWALPPEALPLLDPIVAVLARYPELEFEIAGHIDARKSDLFRRRSPSRRRAEAVRDYFILQGINPQRLRAVGYGEELPIASNDTAQGRAQNRRVEISVHQPPWASGGVCAPREPPP